MSDSEEQSVCVNPSDEANDLDAAAVERPEDDRNTNSALDLVAESPISILHHGDGEAEFGGKGEQMQAADATVSAQSSETSQTKADNVNSVDEEALCPDCAEIEEKCAELCKNDSGHSELGSKDASYGADSRLRHPLDDDLFGSDEHSNADVESDFATIDISDTLKMSLSGTKPPGGATNVSGATESRSVASSASGKPIRDTWHSVFEVRNREMGYGSRYNGMYAFTHKVCGSVYFTRKLVRYATLNGHSGCVNALHFNESGTLLASGSDDLDIHIWNWIESKSSYSFNSGHRSNVFQCKFMPFTGDCHLVSCAREGMVRLAELSSTGTCRGTKKLASHRGAAHKLALLSDSSHVFYSCGEDAVTYEIDLRQEKANRICVTKENNRKVELYSIHAHPFKSHEFVVGGRDYHVRIYDARNINENVNEGVVKKFCPKHMVGTESKANITCAVYNFDGSEILGSYNDEDIYLFDNMQQEVTNHHLRQYTGHRNNATVKGVNFYGPKSEFVVSGSDCGNVFLWEKDSEQIVNYFAADDGGVVNVLEPHPHFAVLATSGLDHDVKVWLPLSEEPAKLDGLEELMRKNSKERETDRSEPDIDSRMLWLLMHHLRRSARRQMRNLEEDPGTSSSDESNEMEDEDDEDGEDQDEPTQCNPS